MRVFVAILLLLLALPGVAAADEFALPQSGATALPPPAGNGREVLLPILPADPAGDLDRLFAELSASDADAAPLIERRIRAIWLTAGDRTTQLLLSWADRSMAGQELPAALDYLDEAIAAEPTVAESYYRRAMVHVLMEEVGPAISDIETVLRIEPRQFLAMRALAEIMQSLGDDQRALEVLRRIQVINRHLPGLDADIEAIVAGSHGRDI